MYTWALILVANMLVLAGGSILLMKRSGYRSIKPLVFLVVIALVTGGIWLTAQNHLEETVIGQSKAVMTWEQCPSDSNKVIYYDEEEGSYFFVTYDNWEVAPLFKRNYLDPIRTAEFVNLHFKMENYKIENMIISK